LISPHRGFFPSASQCANRKPFERRPALGKEYKTLCLNAKKPYKNLLCLSLFVHPERLLVTPAVLLSADSHHGFA
jgi:hypothetical protein